MSRVCLVTSPNRKCGIFEHSSLLQESCIPHGIHHDLVGPEVIEETTSFLVVVDHHAALHAAWTPKQTQTLRDSGAKVVVTQHDTYETLDIMKDRGLHDFHDHVDALIVHEPVEGLTDQGYPNVFYWRQPVPDLPLDVPPEPAGYVKPLNDPPIVGTVGFDFPWKGFEELKEVAGKAGWDTAILGGPENWLPRNELIKELRACDATAFLYSTGNSGTSAAIRMGIAARRPLIAYRCRQFRDLVGATPLGSWNQDLLWAGHLVEARAWLDGMTNDVRRNVTANVVALADQLSWTNAGRRYARLYRSLLS